ncbi:Poly(beta-D-mannuronate) lyase [Aurantiacibacter atlanticus]|uniref:Poly(Beta-D-mannuronate) lyase n=1 Tax=Aurantiacibacter atlanticus TaxID=1648404 RepID=A0A0H4VEL1_9SPHN|nr:chondroitinase-B domain-containing protein [Aurantiacibacter atlanticus]AKQ43137.2 Poly(beta-D-mannuronate) lyase [Aurantiacibacter atlanticus]
MAAISLFAIPAQAEDYHVANQEEYSNALNQIDAGDAIILADGEWRDFEMVVAGHGTADRPITIRSQTPGGVTLTGQSNLRIGGHHILVSGLVFTNGYSPTGEVIAFRRDSDELAYDTRVTQIVIDSFSKPDRTESDIWVAMFGRNNRFDHNNLIGKTNPGVTLAVRLNSEESRENNHRIDHNYFGPRPVLGSNGGETLRIGTSHYSMFNSNTVVENNVFDRVDGEVEIISSKSGSNVIRENLFLRSAGAVTLRHGDNSLVERNVFLGHGKDHTGGIRVINRNQTVRDNYMEGLRGTGFTSALTVMNGVPNSPVNRYVQVDGAVIEGNSVLDSYRITLGAGADAERSAPPVNTSLLRNLFSGLDDGTFIEVDADISGIALRDNALIAGSVHSAAEAISRAETEMVRAATGLLYPTDPALAEIGAPRDLRVMSLDEVGASYYGKPDNEGPFQTGRTLEVSGDGYTLFTAFKQARDGDILQIAPGTYELERTLQVDHSLTIRGVAAQDGTLPIIRFARPSLFEIRDGGGLQLEKLVIDGELAPDAAGNSVIRTSNTPILGNVLVELDSVEMRNLTVNRNFNVITIGKATMADAVTIRNSSFSDITGTIVSAFAEVDDLGRYNVDYLTIEDSHFTDIGGALANVYRGGTDESTFGPHVNIRNSHFTNVGRAANAGTSLTLHGVQETEISGNSFTASAPLSITHTVGTPNTRLSGNEFVATLPPQLTELNFAGEPRVEMTRNNFFSEAAQ